MALEDDMRVRFHELGAQRDQKLAVSGPLRAQRDLLIAEHEATITALNAQIKEAEAGLYEIDTERGRIARFLVDPKTGKANTGEPLA